MLSTGYDGRILLGGQQLLEQRRVDLVIFECCHLWKNARVTFDQVKTMQPDEKSRWELGNYIVVLLALIIVLLITMTRRNLIKPIPLNQNSGESS